MLYALMEQAAVAPQVSQGEAAQRTCGVAAVSGAPNAGKSTLLNTLTKSNVFTENRLFATLDPKSSSLRFPRDREAIITVTVGFIRELPRDLFAAFRATLGELNEANVLLHVPG